MVKTCVNESFVSVTAQVCVVVLLEGGGGGGLGGVSLWLSSVTVRRYCTWTRGGEGVVAW